MHFSNKFIRANGEVCDFDNHVPSPYFRKEFDMDFAAENSEILICGLGFYRLWINGSEITKGALAPYISNTGDICYYDLYSVAPLLKKGKTKWTPRSVDSKDVPDLQGMAMRDALYILENKGFRVTFKGSGKVVEQSLPPGANKTGIKTILLTLQ